MSEYATSLNYVFPSPGHPEPVFNSANQRASMHLRVGEQRQQAQFNQVVNQQQNHNNGEEHTSGAPTAVTEHDSDSEVQRDDPMELFRTLPSFQQPHRRDARVSQEIVNALFRRARGLPPRPEDVNLPPVREPLTWQAPPPWQDVRYPTPPPPYVRPPPYEAPPTSPPSYAATSFVSENGVTSEDGL